MAASFLALTLAWTPSTRKSRPLRNR